MKNLFFSSQGFIIPKFLNLFLLISMQEKDIRWLQRFSHFNKALQKLKEAVDKSKTESLTELEKEGTHCTSWEDNIFKAIIIP